MFLRRLEPTFPKTEMDALRGDRQKINSRIFKTQLLI